MTTSATELPPQIRRRLLSAFVARTADRVLKDSDGKTGSIVDSAAGDVFTWLWRTDPDQAMLRMADLMLEIHIHQPHANPEVRLGDVLAAFRPVMPPDVTDGEYQRFVSDCRARVPRFYEKVSATG